MAQDPKAHAEAYGLEADILKTYEDEEGAPSGHAHQGQDRTVRPEHAGKLMGHGPKTAKRSKEIINGRL